MHLSRYAVVVLAAIGGVGTACTDAPRSASGRRALIGGALSTQDPAVVGLTFGDSGQSFCTATLISPSVILTAGHCVDMAGSDPTILAFFGDDLAQEGRRVTISKNQVHPGWTGEVGANDVGLMLLTSAQDPTLPIPLNRSPLTQHQGDPYRHIGFGVFERETQADVGKKREGTTTITGIQSDVVLSGDATVSVCFGDSGGPGLISIDGIEHVGGVHSFTSGSQCNPPNGDTRVDLFADTFIIPWIEDNDPVCGKDGTCAAIGCTADPDCEPCGADGTCTEACVLPDPDCATSALGDICQADSQCTTDLCVFWTGDNSYHFCTEPCDPAQNSCPTGMTCTAVPPFGNVCYFEDDPQGVLGDDCAAATDCGSYQCEDDVCVIECDLGQGLACPEQFVCQTRDDSRFFCYARGGGGDGGMCSAAGGASSASIALFILLLGVAWRRARQVFPIG